MTTSLSPATADPAAGPLERFLYRIQFTRSSDGKQIDAGAIDPSWPKFWHEQAMFQAQRRDVIGPDPSNAVIREHPLFLDGESGSVTGVRIAAGTGHVMHETDFTLADAFAAPGDEALKKLVDSKVLKADDKATFKVFAEPNHQNEMEPDTKVKATITRSPLPIAGEGCLEDYLKIATPQGEMDEKDHPLFLPRELFERAREYCFKTGRQEGGAMMVSRMFRQPGPEPDLFAVVHGALELRHAKQSLFGFEPTSQTFADLNAQLNLRRSRLGFPDELPAILVHNHPFEPSVRDDGEANCKTCPIQKECQLSSSFYSTSDVNFHLSMYGRQPYVAGIVIGLTPRQEDDVRMFCLEGTRTRERGFHWID